MKQFLFISLIAALMCASSSVSQAKASRPKAGIEKVDFSPPLHVIGTAEVYNLTSLEIMYAPVSPAQTLVLCDKGTTAISGNGYASEMKVNTSKREVGACYFHNIKTGLRTFDSGATGRNPRDGLSYS